MSSAFRQVRWGLLSGAVLLVAALALTNHGPASAFTGPPLWGCRSSAVYASVGGNNRVEPIVANGNPNTGGGTSPDRAQCVNQDAGLDGLATQLGIPTNVVAAKTTSAQTSIVPEIGKAIDQKATATAKAENLTLPLTTGSVVLGVAAANSSATASCKKGVDIDPHFDGTSQLTGITIGGQTVSLDALTGALTDALKPLGPIISIVQNEKITTKNSAGKQTSLTVNALHVKVLQAAGANPVLDLVVAQSKVAAGADVCDPNKQLPPGTGNGAPCPPGSTYVVDKNLCVIVVGGSTIVVGKPYQGPSGGTVITLAEAQKRYPNSPCVHGPGPKFAVIGTNKRDFITGSNKADRILSLGGADKVDGGRGNDCIDAGTGDDRATGAQGNDHVYGFAGRDTLTGDLGNDKIYGGSDADHLNGGPGIDYLYGDAGADTLNGGYNADHVFGGSGNDAINIAQQGPAATANCGPGTDKIRLNKKERFRIKNCEIQYILQDK